MVDAMMNIAFTIFFVCRKLQCQQNNTRKKDEWKISGKARKEISEYNSQITVDGIEALQDLRVNVVHSTNMNGLLLGSVMQWD